MKHRPSIIQLELLGSSASIHYSGQSGPRLYNALPSDIKQFIYETLKKNDLI